MAKSVTGRDIKHVTGRDKGNTFLRVFQILEAVADMAKPVSLVEISERTGLPLPTTHRLCQMLLQERFLQYEVGGKHVWAGPRVFGFAGRVLSGAHLNMDRRNILQDLVDEVGETCNVSIPDDLTMIYADRVESGWPLRIQLKTGTHVPLHCTASGKLYLSQLPPEKVDRILARQELERMTQSTITRPADLRKELAKIKRSGYGWDNEEFITGMVAVSVPVRDSKGRFCAAIAVHGPTQRMSLSSARKRLPALRRAAERIETLIADR